MPEIERPISARSAEAEQRPQAKNLAAFSGSLGSLGRVFDPEFHGFIATDTYTLPTELQELFDRTLKEALSVAQLRPSFNESKESYFINEATLTLWLSSLSAVLKEEFFKGENIKAMARDDRVERDLDDIHRRHPEWNYRKQRNRHEKTREQIHTIYGPTEELLGFLDEFFGQNAYENLMKIYAEKKHKRPEEARIEVNELLLAAIAVSLFNKENVQMCSETGQGALSFINKGLGKQKFPVDKPANEASPKIKRQEQESNKRQFIKNPESLELIFDRGSENLKPFETTKTQNLGRLEDKLKTRFTETFTEALRKAKKYPLLVGSEGNHSVIPNEEILMDWGLQWAEFVRSTLFVYSETDMAYKPRGKFRSSLNKTFGKNGYTTLIRRYMINKKITEPEAQKAINQLLLNGAASSLLIQQLEIGGCSEQEKTAVAQTCYKGISALSFDSKDAANNQVLASHERLSRYLALFDLLQSVDGIINECEKQRAKQADGIYNFPIYSEENAMDNAPAIIGAATDGSMKKAYIWDCAKIKFDATKEKIQREIKRLDSLNQAQEDENYDLDITDLEKELSSTTTFLENHEEEFPDMQNPILKIKRILSDAFKKAASKIGVNVKYSTVEATSNIKKTTSALFANAGQPDNAADAKAVGTAASPKRTAASAA